MYEFAAPIPSRSDLDFCWFLRSQGRAGEALERALHDIGVMQPGGWANWAPSPLTGTGAPVEMIFTEGQSGLAVRTDVDDPAKNPHDRLQAALAAVGRVGAHPLRPGLQDVISAAQSSGGLQFGARLGLQYAAAGLSLTVYVEVPPGAFDLTGLLMAHQQTMPKPPAAELVMLGYTGETGVVTRHFAAQTEPEAVLQDLAAQADVPLAPLVAAIAALREKQTIGTDLHAASFVLKDTPGATAPELTVILPTLPGATDDARIRRALHSAWGRPVPGYETLMDVQHPAPKGQILQGRLGLTAKRNGAPQLSVFVAAPWHTPGEPH